MKTDIQKYDVPVVVTLNSFLADTEAEIDYIRRFCEERDCEFALLEVWEISKEIYGADGVVFEPAVKKQLAKITEYQKKEQSQDYFNS